MLIEAVLHFPRGYIAHPYWPAREKLINIQKASGINRVRSDERRQKALSAYLTAHGLTLDDYRQLEAAASRPFYTYNGTDEIVIPAHQLYGLLAQAADLAPAVVRPVRVDQIRTVIELSDFRTGRFEASGVYERYVPVKSGTGQTLSNQRSLRSDPYLADVTATGTVRVAQDDLAPRIRQFIEWAGAEIGVGAARKMGWGRFRIVEWREV